MLRATTPVLRARTIRRGLAQALQATGCRRRDDLLRLASWQLEGGGHSSPDLLVAAALRARTLFDPDLAARLAKAAVEAGAGFDASLIAAESLHTAGRAGAAKDLLSELEPAAHAEADRARVALARAANLVTGFGRAGDAEAVVSRVENIVTDQDLRDELRAMRGTIALVQGRSQQALDAALAVLHRPDISQRARVRALLVAVPAWTQTGAIETAINTAEQLVAALGRSDEALPEVVELLRLGLCFAYGFAGRLDDAHTMAVEAFALHEAVRLGLVKEVADRLAVLAAGVVDGRLVSAYAAHAVALVAGKVPALQKISVTFEELGAILIAAEVAAEVARAYQREGRSASAPGCTPSLGSARGQSWPPF